MARFLLALCALALCCVAQPAPVSLNLQQAVDAALARYPSIRVSEAEVRGAAAAIERARTAYLPSLAGVAGVNRATRNNSFGLLLPSQVIAPISGPVLGTNSLESAWGSTAGLLATWEPFDFGQRQASVAVAEAGRARAEAAVRRTRLDVATMTADTVLTMVAAEQTVIAAQASVDRAKELHRLTEALVKSGLRPGSELSLAAAEQASAQVQLIRARQAVAESKAVLGALTGLDPQSFAIDRGSLLRVVELPTQSSDFTASPAAREQDAVALEAQARLKLLERSYYPHFAIQGTTYARGTGALIDGRLPGGANGLGPNIQNWGVGFTATFNIFDYQTIRARRHEESARLEAEKARYDLVLTGLRSRQNQAQAAVDGAVEIAQTTPLAIAAARTGAAQAGARYQSGLGTALEVADAQRRLAQAEIDDSLARLGIWRAKLAMFAVAGDLAPLLAEASK